MPTSTSVTYLTRQFDDFLFARIDEGKRCNTAQRSFDASPFGCRSLGGGRKTRSIAPRSSGQEVCRFHCSDTWRSIGISKRQDGLRSIAQPFAAAGQRRNPAPPELWGARNKEVSVWHMAGRNRSYSGDLTDRTDHQLIMQANEPLATSSSTVLP